MILAINVPSDISKLALEFAKDLELYMTLTAVSTDVCVGTVPNTLVADALRPTHRSGHVKTSGLRELECV